MPKDQQQMRYEYIAHQINREDNLVNHRLTWSLQLNGFLFAALAFVGEKIEPSMKHFFLFALPITGFAVSLAGFLGVYAAVRQLRYLIGLLNIQPDDRWPRPFGDPVARRLGTIPSFGSVGVLSLVWLFLLIYNLW